MVPEAWRSAPSPGDELDSLAVWPSETGTPWVIATAKSSHRLVVFDGDSDQRLRSQGYFSAETFNQRLIERMKVK